MAATFLLRKDPSAEPSMPPLAAPAQPETSALVALAQRLTDSLRSLIRSSPLDGLGPIELARTLQIDKSFASRLMSALRATDPLAALSALPGTGPLRQFIRAAREHGAEPAAASAAERELHAFD